jgi:hypothetical protein
MKRAESRLVDAKTVDLLLTERNGRLDPTTLPPKTTLRLYVLDDGGAVLVFPDRTGRHFASFNDMREEHRAMEERARKERAETDNDMLTDLLSLRSDFVVQLPQLMAALPRLIDVEASTLDATESSIDAIDAAIDAAGSEPFLAGDVFQSLLAYVGEVVRRAIGGRWDLLSQDDGRTWEPDIIDAQGNRCNLLRVYKEILEHGEEGNLRAFAHHTIRTHRREGRV